MPRNKEGKRPKKPAKQPPAKRSQPQPPSDRYQPPANRQQPLPDCYQQLANRYQPPANQYQPPANRQQPLPDCYQQLANRYQQPANHNQPPANRYQPPAQSSQVLGNRPPQPGQQLLGQRPQQQPSQYPQYHQNQQSAQNSGNRNQQPVQQSQPQPSAQGWNGANRYNGGYVPQLGNPQNAQLGGGKSILPTKKESESERSGTSSSDSESESGSTGPKQNDTETPKTAKTAGSRSSSSSSGSSSGSGTSSSTDSESEPVPSRPNANSTVTAAIAKQTAPLPVTAPIAKKTTPLPVTAQIAKKTAPIPVTAPMTSVYGTFSNSNGGSFINSGTSSYSGISSSTGPVRQPNRSQYAVSATVTAPEKSRSLSGSSSSSECSSSSKSSTEPKGGPDPVQSNPKPTKVRIAHSAYPLSANMSAALPKKPEPLAVPFNTQNNVQTARAPGAKKPRAPRKKAAPQASLASSMSALEPGRWQNNGPGAMQHFPINNNTLGTVAQAATNPGKGAKSGAPVRKRAQNAKTGPKANAQAAAVPVGSSTVATNPGVMPQAGEIVPVVKRPRGRPRKNPDAPPRAPAPKKPKKTPVNGDDKVAAKRAPVARKPRGPGKKALAAAKLLDSAPGALPSSVTPANTVLNANRQVPERAAVPTIPANNSCQVPVQAQAPKKPYRARRKTICGPTPEDLMPISWNAKPLASLPKPITQAPVSATVTSQNPLQMTGPAIDTNWHFPTWDSVQGPLPELSLGNNNLDPISSRRESTESFITVASDPGTRDDISIPVIEPSGDDKPSTSRSFNHRQSIARRMSTEWLCRFVERVVAIQAAFKTFDTILPEKQ